MPTTDLTTKLAEALRECRDSLAAIIDCEGGSGSQAPEVIDADEALRQYDAAKAQPADVVATRLAVAEEMAAQYAAQLDEVREQKDGAYLERNRCVALIARMALALGLKAGVAKTAIEGWSEDWHGCVYIDLPEGQASWHFHDSQACLFDGLPAYAGAWDGHSTPEKYERVAASFAAPVAQAVPRKPLTREQVKDLIPDGDGWKFEVGFDEAIAFARAIEAAHGIKENNHD